MIGYCSKDLYLVFCNNQAGDIVSFEPFADEYNEFGAILQQSQFLSICGNLVTHP